MISSYRVPSRLLEFALSQFRQELDVVLLSRRTDLTMPTTRSDTIGCCIFIKLVVACVHELNQSVDNFGIVFGKVNDTSLSLLDITVSVPVN